MKPEESQERVDPRLAAAYAALRDESVPDADWERLRRSIRDRATPVLRRKHARRVLSGSRSFVPLALAASVAFALWLGPTVLFESPTLDPVAEFTNTVEDDAVLLEALVADLTEQEFRMLVTGRANPEALLAVAVGER